MDDRYCIDNGAMIGWAGLLSYIANGISNISFFCTCFFNPHYFLGEKGDPFEKTDVTQRFRTDEVYVNWRDD